MKSLADFLAAGVLVLAMTGLVRAADSPAPPVTSQPATQAATQADPKVVAALVDQLNHNDFKVREAATKKLIALGEPVRPMLEAELKKPDPDPEVVLRINIVLNEIGIETVKLTDQVSMKFKRIPAGKFMMGSPDGEKDRQPNEGPQHEVAISKPFYMGIYHVTQEQYEAVMGKNPSNFKGPQNPVETVSWDEAVEFCKKASEKAGKKVRLPTEAEWEYACRAGSKTRFCFGDDDDKLGDFAWYAANSGNTTHPVGQKKPNAWGLYDLHGNVWQWCADRYDDKYYGNSPKTDPTGPAEGPYRVLRGGSWNNSPQGCRSAFRINNAPDGRNDLIGFRVAMDSK